MKKTITLAMMAVLLVAGSASAQWGRHAVAEPNATFPFAAGNFGGMAGGPTTTNNDDSCDIAVAPAATLLLPYFEVETASRSTTTQFQITNTSRYAQIAHVTVWTDWSYPVLDFNVFLTGYDVQPIDLYDVIVNNTIGSGTSQTTAAGKVYNQQGQDQAASNYALTVGTSATQTNANPNFRATGINCAGLPGQFNTDIGAAVRNALVNGVYNSTGFPNPPNGCPSSPLVGSAAGHNGTTSTTTAVGYVTVDVAAACTAEFPTDATYYTQTILFDNVLTGDYQIFNKAAGNNYAGGNPLVHIRAIPEGGAAGLTPGTNLPYTFYDRYTRGLAAQGLTARQDRRQPLPSVWAARYLYSATGNAAAGIPPLDTRYRIWREGVTGNATAAGAMSAATSCSNASLNRALPIAEQVRFDEHENSVILTSTNPNVSPNLTTNPATLPETSSQSVSNTNIFAQIPASVSTDAGGWFYLNLNAYSGSAALTANTSAAGGTRASQNWVVVAESGATTGGAAAGAYAVDFNATWLGNGCSGAVGATTLYGGTVTLGPVGGSVCTPVSGTPASTACTGVTFTNVTP